MYCIKCGTDNPNDAVYCKACGSPMKEDTPAENVPLSEKPLDSAATLDYNNPEPPKAETSAPALHYESRGAVPERTVSSHPRSYSPAYSSLPSEPAPSPAPVYTPYTPVYSAPFYTVPYTYRTVAVPTYEYRTVAVPAYPTPWYVVPTWKY